MTFQEAKEKFLLPVIVGAVASLPGGAITGYIGATAQMAVISEKVSRIENDGVARDTRIKELETGAMARQERLIRIETKQDLILMRLTVPPIAPYTAP